LGEESIQDAWKQVSILKDRWTKDTYHQGREKAIGEKKTLAVMRNNPNDCFDLPIRATRDRGGGAYFRKRGGKGGVLKKESTNAKVLNSPYLSPKPQKGNKH